MRLNLPKILLFVGMILLLVPGFVFSQSKAMSLPTNGFCQQSGQLGAACKKNWETIAAFCNKVYKAEKSNSLDTIDCDEIGPANALANQILRDGQALKNLREPAGVDWMHRGKFCADTLRAAAGKLKAIEAGKALTVEAEKYKTKSMKKRASAVDKVAKLFEKGNIKKAEADLDEILQEVDRFGLWLSSESGRQVYGQVEGMRKQMAQRTKELRAAEASQKLAAALKTHPPKIDELLEAANKAVTAIGAGSDATIDGQPKNGPEAVNALYLKWQVAHSNLLRSMGIGWISQGLPMAADAKPEKLIGSRLGATTFTDAVTKLEAQMTDLIPRIVAADMKQVADADAMNLYVSYLKAVGTMSNNVPKKLIVAIEKELDVLQDRPGIGEKIQNYKKVTDDILFWRKRLVASSKKSVELTPELLAATESLNKFSYIPTLTSGLDKVELGLNQNAMGFQTHVNNVRALTANAAFGNFQKRVWSTVLGELDVSSEVTALRNELYISPKSPPLSVAAAQSIATATRKSFVAVGGPVSKIQIEAMGSRFPKLPSNMNTLVPLDYCPTENALFEDMLLRFNVTPEWIEHEHFFKKLVK